MTNLNFIYFCNEFNIEIEKRIKKKLVKKNFNSIQVYKFNKKIRIN